MTGETVNEALQAGQGALRIASVRSRSVTTYTAGAPEPATETQLAVEGGSVGGTTFGYGPQGLVVGTNGVPVPTAAGLDQLNAALKPAGISIRFVNGQKVVGGATADALELRMQQASPGSGIPGGIVTVRFGGATTAVTVGKGVGLGLEAPPATDAGRSDDGAVPTPLDSSPSPGSAVSGPLPTGSTGLYAAGGPTHAPFAALPASPSVPAAPFSGSASAPSAAPAPSAPSLSGPSELAFQPRHLDADGFFYGTLLIGGLVMLALSSLWRGKGMLRP